MVSGAEIDRFAEGRRVVTYSRVSTQEQDPDMQIYALREFAAARGFAIQKEYVDIITGSFEKRRDEGLTAPAFDALMADVRAHRIDCLLVWKYDRFSRSLFALITAQAEFARLGVDFISTTQGIDTTTPGGRLAFHIMGCFASYEREILIERVKCGMEKARAKGIRIGPPERDPAAKHRALELQRQGLTLRAIAVREGYSVSGILRMIRRAKRLLDEIGAPALAENNASVSPCKAVP